MLNRRFVNAVLIVLLTGVTGQLAAQLHPTAPGGGGSGSQSIGADLPVPPAVGQSRPAPEWVRYYVFFPHVAKLEKLAAREEALGKSEEAAAWRVHEQRAAGLTESEGAILKEAAASYTQVFEDSEAALKEARHPAKGEHPESIRSRPAPEATRILLTERQLSLEAFIDDLRRRLGEDAFGKLDKYVRENFGASVHAGRPTPISEDLAGVPEATPASPILDPPTTPPILNPPPGGTDLQLDPSDFVYTYSHTTVSTTSSATVAYAECGTILNGDTPLWYDSVVTECWFLDTTTNTTLWNDELQSSSYALRDGGPFTLVPGHSYVTTGSHQLTMFPCELVLGLFLDEFGLIQTPQTFTNGGYIISSGLLQCWPFYIWQLSTTRTTSYTEPALSIQPSAPTVLPGQQQHFTVKPAYVTVTWSVDHAVGTSGIDPVSGVFTAPANSALHGREVFVVTARSNSDPSVVASTNVTVDPVTVSIQGIHVMLAPLGASQKLSANVGGATGSLTWTMNPIVGTLTPEPINGLTATYTVTSLVKDVQTVNVTACLNPQTCSDPFPIELVPAVNISSIAPLTWPAGSAVLATLTGWGFGNNPGTVAATGISFFVTSWSNVEIKANVVIPQNLAGLTPVTVSNVIDGILTSGQFNQVQVIPPTIKITVAPKTVQLREGEKQTFLAPVLCTTQDGKSCIVGQAVNWTATAGTIDSGGVYTAPSNGVTTATVRGCAAVSPTVCDTATVTINLIGVSVIPSTATLNGCDTRQFGAQVTNGISPSVTWSITPSTGTIDATGFYKAPCPFPGPGSTVTVKACSTVDAARCGVATATLTPVFTVGSISPTSGPMAGGTTVTINGGGFSGAATVSFGGLPATGVTVVNGGQITAVTPSHACGPVDVVVTVGGQSQTLTSGFLYTSPQPPTGLNPNGAIFPSTTTSVALSWAAVSGATQYAVRVQDNMDGTIRDPRNNCPTNTLDLCVDGVAATTITVPVRSGHTYNWWVLAGSACGQYSAQTNGSFSVANPTHTTAITPNAGPMAGGTSVTITGTDFRAGAAVTIGGAAATSVTVLSATQITAITPAHACGTVDVVVTDPGDAGGTLSGGFFYSSPQPPTGLSPNGTVIPASTTSVTLSWAAVSGATQYAVRVQDNTDGTIRDPRNNCPTNTIQLCVNGVPTTSYSVPVKAGHSYTWWVHAGSSCGQYSAQTTATFSVANPIDNAMFISQTPPSSCMFPGSTATVTVTMRNTGNTVWDSTYRLGSQNPQDNGTWGIGRVFLAPGETISPAGQKTFTFTVTMPSAAGTYNFQWRMVHEGVQWFGDFSPNVTSTNTAPSSPTGLAPNGSVLAVGTTSVTLTWSPTPGATRYAVRVQDNTDGTIRDPRNNCPTNTIDLCVNDIASTSYTVPVTSGHSYTWWVHAGNCAAYSLQTTATFSVPVTPLHAPTGLYKDPPSRNLVWTPPDNLTGADSVIYDLWIYGVSTCASGCLYHPGAPSWYTMGAEILPGTYTWTLKANSVSRPSSGPVSGPSFTMP